MSAVTSEKLPNEPIVIMTVTGNVADLSKAEQDRQQLNSLLDAVSEPVFFVLDLSNIQINVADLSQGASAAYLGDNPTLKHPNIREILHVSENLALEFAAEGLDSETFGHVKVRRFASLDEALAYARA